MRRSLAACLVILALVSCGGDEGDQPSVITGTVVEVESQGLTEVDSFVVSSEGQRHTILLDDETDLGFPPSHLNEHRISGEPVRVEVDEREGELVATSIEDA